MENAVVTQSQKNDVTWGSHSFANHGGDR